MSIKFFSAGFYLEECNFVITGLPTTSKAKKISDSIFIVEKLLLRGLPTKPSTFLDNEMGKHFEIQLSMHQCTHSEQYIDAILIDNYTL